MAMESDPTKIIRQIDHALGQYQALRSRSVYDDCSDQPDNEVTALITKLASTIDRAAPPGSRYRVSAEEAISKSGPTNAYLLTVLPGILTALREAFVAGH